VGEKLYSKDEKHFAQVQADSSLVLEDAVGSIHKLSARLLKKENNNGWTYWYVKRKEQLISIDELRDDYERELLKLKEPTLKINF
jgi:hypothetical protein